MFKRFFSKRKDFLVRKIIWLGCSKFWCDLYLEIV